MQAGRAVPGQLCGMTTCTVSPVGTARLDGAGTKHCLSGIMMSERGVPTWGWMQVNTLAVSAPGLRQSACKCWHATCN